ASGPPADSPPLLYPQQPGEVSEWPKERDWKSRTCRKVGRGFESLPLRFPDRRAASPLARAADRLPASGPCGSALSRSHTGAQRRVRKAECSSSAGDGFFVDAAHGFLSAGSAGMRQERHEIV